MSRLTVGSIEGLSENSNVISVPTGHSLNVADAGGLQIGGSAVVSAGLVFISRTTVGSAVSSVTVSGAFSSDYDNYRIMLSGGAAGGSVSLRMTLGAITTGYYWGAISQTYSTATNGQTGETNTSHFFVGLAHPNSLNALIELQSPHLVEYPHYHSVSSRSLGSSSGHFYQFGGFLANTASQTDFTLFPSSGTMTGGTVDVYGYAKA